LKYYFPAIILSFIALMDWQIYSELQFKKNPGYLSRYTGWTAGVRFPKGAKIVLYATASRKALWPTQPPNQWVPRALYQRLSVRGMKLTIHLQLLPKSRMVVYLHSLTYIHDAVLN
jgi:hypothetical protein